MPCAGGFRVAQWTSGPGLFMDLRRRHVPIRRVSTVADFRTRTLLPRVGLTIDCHCVLCRDLARAVAVLEYLDKFGAKEKDLGRIIEPYQQHRQRPGGAINRADAGLPQIKADQQLAE